MEMTRKEITLDGHFGCKYKVYKTKTGTWAWVDTKGCGFTNESLQYILDYLAETKGIKL